MNASHLVQRHLPLLKVRRLLVLDKLAQQQFAADLLLIRQPGNVHRAQPHQQLLLALQPLVIGLYRVVRDLVVVPLIPQRRSKLGIVPQPVFPVVFENRVQLFAVAFNLASRGRSSLRARRSGNTQHNHKQSQQGKTQNSQWRRTSG